MNRRLHSPLAEFVSSQHAQTLCFWAEEETYDHVELGFGQAVRLKTKGDSPFIGNINFVVCSVAKVTTCLLLTSLSEKLRHCPSAHVCTCHFNCCSMYTYSPLDSLTSSFPASSLPPSLLPSSLPPPFLPTFSLPPSLPPPFLPPYLLPSSLPPSP